MEQLMPLFLDCYVMRYSYNRKLMGCSQDVHYKFEYKFVMIKSAEEIELEYQALRQTVEIKIKHLQGKLNKNTNDNHLHQISHHQHIYHTLHCHCHHCHLIQTQHSQRSCSHNPISSDLNSNCSNKSSNIHNVNPIIPNGKFEDVVLQSLKNQRQISQQIKSINSKLDGLSQKDYLSNLPSQASQERKKSANKPSEHLYVLKQQNQKPRSRSQANKVEIKDKHRHHPNRLKTGDYGVDETLRVSGHQYYKNKMSSKHDKINDNAYKAKNSHSLPSHYMVRLKTSRSDQNVVPKHFPHGLLTYGKISLKDLRRKEVYRDAEHRNVKHQKDHLLESFKLQDRMRKKLISKIMQNCFKEYGAR